MQPFAENSAHIQAAKAMNRYVGIPGHTGAIIYEVSAIYVTPAHISAIELSPKK